MTIPRSAWQAMPRVSDWSSHAEEIAEDMETEARNSDEAYATLRALTGAPHPKMMTLQDKQRAYARRIRALYTPKDGK